MCDFVQPSHFLCFATVSFLLQNQVDLFTFLRYNFLKAEKGGETG